MEALEIGGAIAIALGLVEVIKLMVYKFTGEERGPFPTPDGYAKEIVWRERMGSIIKQQHDLSKEMQQLIHNQNSILQGLLTLLQEHDHRTRDAVGSLEDFLNRVDAEEEIVIRKKET